MNLTRARFAAATLGVVLAFVATSIVATSADAAGCNYTPGAYHKVINGDQAQAFLLTSCTYGQTRAFYTLNGGNVSTPYSTFTSYTVSGSIVAVSPATVGGNVPTAFQSQGKPGGEIIATLAKRTF